MNKYKIDLRFVLGREGGALYVKLPEGGDKAVASGFTRHEHGCGEDIHLLHLIRKRLEEAGIFLVRKRVQKDDKFAHLFGDEFTTYLRTPWRGRTKHPNFWIVDLNWAVHSPAEKYNAGEEVRFHIQGDIFQEKGKPPRQPEWWKMLKELCDSAGVPCELNEELQQQLEAEPCTRS